MTPIRFALIGAGTIAAIHAAAIDDIPDAEVAVVYNRGAARGRALAAKLGVPYVAGVEEAVNRDDVDAVIGSHEGLRGVIHCYTGGPDHARRYLDRGFVVSFAGILTFPKGENVREAARVVPLDRTMVETDAPFLAPVPYRGKRNEPAYVAHTAAALAALHGLEPDEIARRTSQVAADLFRFAVE